MFPRKALEKVVHGQVCEYLYKFELLDPRQSGFKKGHSTATALLKVTDDIRSAMDKRQLTTLCLFDFSKAFDSINHQLFLAKLKSIGFSESAILWFKSYLSYRQQRVVLANGSASEWAYVERGVPQGSVLGPLCFSIYMNGIPKVFRYCSFHLYADDLQAYIHFTPNTAHQNIQYFNEDIARLENWAENQSLTLNTSKTQLISIGYTKLLNSVDFNTLPPIKILGTDIPYNSSVNNLGLIFDRTLSWSEHTSSLVKRVISSMHILKRNVPYTPPNLRKLFIQTLIFPIIDYCSVVYNDISETLNIKLQRVQNACVRYVTDARRDVHITPYYLQLGWLKLYERRQLAVAILTCKILKTMNPSYLYCMFKPMGAVHNRDNRYTKTTLQIPIHRTTRFNKSFSCTASRIFNTFQLHEFCTCNNSSYITLRNTLTKRFLNEY